jgi:hypothetical protein
VTARAKQLTITAVCVLVLVIATAWATTQAQSADAEPAHDHAAHVHEPGASESATTDGDLLPAGEDGVVVLDVRDGDVVGGPQTFDLEVGDEVVLRVTGDEVDEVHVHGYDLSASLVPDTPVEMRFDADIPGVFDIELEQRHLRLAVLRVS